MMNKLLVKIYDRFLEPLLYSSKRRAAVWLRETQANRVLDLCSGTGAQVRILRQRNMEAVGVDIDTNMVTHAFTANGAPVIQGDAGLLPLADDSVGAVVIFYALHDKNPDLRARMMSESRRVLSKEGRMVILEFEKAWNTVSRLATGFTWLIERLAGFEHARNSKAFARDGGLKGFMQRHGLVELRRHDIEMGNSAMVLCKFADKG
jgi:demethylmenaquinone methyltransferase/2-methoxy-6-polyprenyl-1,4-benzoquinol methylase